MKPKKNFHQDVRSIVVRSLPAVSLFLLGTIWELNSEMDHFVANLLIISIIAYLSAAFGLKGGLIAALVIFLDVVLLAHVTGRQPFELSGLNLLVRLAGYAALAVFFGCLFEARIKKTEIIESVLYSSCKNASLSLRAFAKAVSSKDDVTGSHCERVAHNCYALAMELCPLEKDRVMAYWSGLLHDIGKIGIDDLVLKKAGKLTDEEYKVIQNHPSIGYDILVTPFEFLESILHGIRHHHERFDGTGYPDGLKGEEIPLVGRIAAVVDVFEALTTVRPYKKAFPISKALAILNEGKGTHFDPQVVDAFVKLLNEGKIAVDTGPLYYAVPEMLPIGSIFKLHKGLAEFNKLEASWFNHVLDDISGFKSGARALPPKQ